jgi:hypothetical protein
VSVQVLCPSCGEVTPFHRPPVTDCPHCHVPLPEPVRAAATRALAIEGAPKPALLMLGQIFSLLAGAIFVVLLIAAPFNAGSYSINDEPVTGPEFLRRVGLMLGVMGILLASIGVGLLRDKPWSRPLMIIYWLAVGVSVAFTGGTSAGDIFAGVLTPLVAAGIAYWYLYVKPNVRAYYESRERVSSAPAEPRVSSDV